MLRVTVTPLGHPEIDAQHLQLYRIAREVAQLATGRGREVRDFWNPDSAARKDLLRLIRELEDYARSHFDYEEQLMERMVMRMPACATHVRAHYGAHEELRGHLGFYRSDVADGRLSAFAIAAFTSVWITNHINRIDLALVGWLKKYDELNALGALPSCNG